jgi:uncharacterized membrane protein
LILRDESKQSAIGNRQSAMNYVSPSVSTRGPVLAWFVMVCLAVVFVGLVVVAPLALAGNHSSIAFVIYKGFSKVCHQIPERSFFLAGYPLAVCSRCTGLYAGFTAALIAYPLFRSFRTTDPPHPRWLLMAAIPLAIDFGLTFVGLWENTHSSRLITGVILGSAAVFYVMPGIADLSFQIQQRFSAPDLNRLPSLNDSLPRNPLPAAPSDYSAPHQRI